MNKAESPILTYNLEADDYMQSGQPWLCRSITLSVFGMDSGIPQHVKLIVSSEKFDRAKKCRLFYGKIIADRIPYVVYNKLLMWLNKVGIKNSMTFYARLELANRPDRGALISSRSEEPPLDRAILGIWARQIGGLRYAIARYDQTFRTWRVAEANRWIEDDPLYWMYLPRVPKEEA